MTVAPAARAPRADEPLRLDRVVCAVDFSEPSLRALEYALSIAQESRSRLTVLHVLEGLHGVELPAHLHFNVGDLRRQGEREARERLERLWPAGVDDWGRPEARVAAGKSYQAILHAATETGAELIVLGAHSRRLVDLGWFGSTTDHVVREASCPVLVARGRWQ
jgi:universal stress protein A